MNNNEISIIKNYYLCLNYLYWYTIYKTKIKQDEDSKVYFKNNNFWIDVWLLEILSEFINFNWLNNLTKRIFLHFKKNKDQIFISQKKIDNLINQQISFIHSNLFFLLFLYNENFLEKYLTWNSSTSIYFYKKHNNYLSYIVIFILKIEEYLNWKSDKEITEIFNDYYILFFQIYKPFDIFFNNKVFEWSDAIFQYWFQFIKRFFEKYWTYISSNSLFEKLSKWNKFIEINTQYNIKTNKTRNVLDNFNKNSRWDLIYHNLRFVKRNSNKELFGSFEINQEIENLNFFIHNLKSFDEETICNHTLLLDNQNVDKQKIVEHFIFDMNLKEYIEYLNLYKNHLSTLKDIWKKIYCVNWNKIKLDILWNSKQNFSFSYWIENIYFQIKTLDYQKNNWLKDFLSVFFENYYMFISLSLIFFHNINILNFLSENIEQIDVKYSDKIYKYFKDEKYNYITRINWQIKILDNLMNDEKIKNILYEYNLQQYKDVLLHLQNEIENFSKNIF